MTLISVMNDGEIMSHNRAKNLRSDAMRRNDSKTPPTVKRRQAALGLGTGGAHYWRRKEGVE